MHVVLEKTTAEPMPPTAMTSQDFASRGSLISEPDYAEIESRGNTRPGSLGTVPSVVASDDGNSTADSVKGYTEIDFGSPRPSLGADDDGIGDNLDSSSGYAVVDFSKKNEDRRIRDLYAAVDFKAKRSRSSEGDESPGMEGDFIVTGMDEGVSSNAKYEGPYDIIPGNLL